MALDCASRVSFVKGASAVYVMRGCASRSSVDPYLVARSPDGGWTWSSMKAGHGIVLDLRVDPERRTHAWATTQEGIEETDDDGATWTRAR